jgi:hypothetical protein
VEEATKVFKDTDNLEIRKILGLDVAQLKSVVDWKAIAELNKKPKTDINEYHCIRVQESLFDEMAESLGYDYTKLRAVKWYLDVYKMLNIPFYIVKSCSGDPVKDEQELSTFFSYAKPNKFKLVSQDETNTIDIENVEQFISQKIKDFLQNLVYPELVTEQDHRKYLHYLVHVMAEKLEDTTVFFKKVNNLITIDGFDVKECIATLKNDYSDIIPHEPRITTDLPTPEVKHVLEIPRRRKSCKLYKKFAFYKIPKMQFVNTAKTIIWDSFEVNEEKEYTYNPPIYDKNHLTFVVDISTDQDDLEGSLTLKCKNFRDKHEQYYRDNNKGEEPPENWLVQIGNDQIFVKPHTLNGEIICSYSDQKHDDSFIPFNDVADEIDPQDLYWIDTYLPSYNFKPSDSTIKDQTQLFDVIASVSEEPDVDSVLATKILNILGHYDSYKNNTITDRILPHYTKDRKLVNLLIKTVKDELMKEQSDDQ